MRKDNSERGVSAVEYAVIIASIAVPLIFSLTLIGGGLSGVLSRVSGSLPDPSSSPTTATPEPPAGSEPPAGTISVPMPYAWLPPSFVSDPIPAPGDPGGSGRPALLGGSPGIHQAKGWTYGDAGSPPVWGASKVQIVGDFDQGFKYQLVDMCLHGAWVGSTGEMGCVWSDWTGGALFDSTSTWDDNSPLVVCTNHTNDSYRDEVRAGFLTNSGFCGSTDNIRSVTFHGVSNGSNMWSRAVIMQSTYTAHPTFTTDLVCQETASGTQRTLSETAEGSAPAVSCPSGSVPIRLTVRGDDTVMQVYVNGLDVADWVKIAADPSNTVLEKDQATGWCSIRFPNSARRTLPFTDCDTATQEGLFG